MTISHAISTTGSRGGRPLVEDALCLRVADLRSAGEWARYHRLTAANGTTVRCRVEVGGASAAWLMVEHWRPDTAWAVVSYSVALIARPQPFGGMRWLFVCPMTDAPCSALFLPFGAKGLASRQAHGLAFGSQRLRFPARAAARAQRIRAVLGGDGASRPTGMHSSTFARHVATLARLDGIAAGLTKDVCEPV